jgi:hypothetical protein
VSEQESRTNFHTWVKPVANIEKGHVLLENDIPAGTYTPGDAALIGSAFSTSATKAEDMHAVITWLIENDMPEDKVEGAVLGLLKKADSDALIRALSPLLGKWA